MSSVWSAAAQLAGAGESFVVVTMVSSRGSAPQDPGSKIIVSRGGLLAGTVGGGKVEARAIEYAKKILEEGRSAPELLTWNLQKDIGMTCGGEVTYLFELSSHEAWRIVIFGAGHVAQHLVRTLLPLSCSITCVDWRREWTDRLPSAPNLKGICQSDPAALVKDFSDKSFFVSMTQGHSHDVPILAEIFRHHPGAPYVGVIGSEIKGKKIRAELLEKGVEPRLLEKLRCPIGLSIGSNDPAEIAISVAAEFLQLRDLKS